MSDSLKSIFFFGIFILLVALYLLVYGTYFLGLSDITAATVTFFLGTAPLFLKDLPALGEYSPPILAGLVAATAPFKKESKIFYFAVGLTIVSYLLYLLLSSFAQSSTALAILEFGGQGPDAQTTAVALLAGIRTFCLVVAGALLGLRANKE